MKLLAGRDREKYGEYKVVEVNWKDWDGDVSKLSPNAVKGLLAVLRQEAARQEAARQEAEEAAREAARQPVKALPAAGEGKDCGTNHGGIRGEAAELKRAGTLASG